MQFPGIYRGIARERPKYDSDPNIPLIMAKL